MKLKLTDIHKTYPNGHSGASGIDLDVKDGEMAVILGPSGCGKTTLLRLICGLEIPEKGKIFLDDQDITCWEPKRRDISMVFQNYALYPHMTVRENLAFGLKSRGMKKEEMSRLVGWAAELLGLELFLDRRPAELSGGQRQRVALGRAIVRKPKLYLFDEPLSNLDAELRMKMRGEILGLHQRIGATSLYVTHDQLEAMSIADKIFVMNKGKITTQGAPKKLYQDPPDIFTAGFLGLPPMNLLEGRIGKDGDFISAKGLKITTQSKDEKLSESFLDVVLGIRPEDIHVTDTGGVDAWVVSVENLGRSSLLLIQTSLGERIKALTENDLKIGQNIKIQLKIDKVYLFDKKSGCRITN